MTFPVGCSAITWRRQAPLEQMLAEIAAAGYAGAPLGQQEGKSHRELVATYESFGLRPAPGYLGPMAVA